MKITNFIVIEILKASRVAWELNVKKPVESCAIYISHTFPRRFGGYPQYGDSGAGPSGTLAAIRKDIRQEGVEAIPEEGDKRRSKKKGNVICAEQRIILSETVPKTPTRSN